MAVAPDPGHPDLLALEILRFFELRRGEDAVGQDVFHAADEDEVRVPMDKGSHDANAAGEGGLRVAPEHRRRYHPGGGDVNYLEFQVVLPIKSRFLGDRGQGLGHDQARVDEVELFRRRGPLSRDRKSTRLNSSHSQISYAGLFLKKKRLMPRISHSSIPPCFYFISSILPTFF